MQITNAHKNSTFYSGVLQTPQIKNANEDEEE